MRPLTDPMELAFAELLDAIGVEYRTDDPSNLDFYLPKFDLYVEVKQFHSERIGEQMGRRPDVIAIQGRGAMNALIDLLEPCRLNT